MTIENNVYTAFDDFYGEVTLTLQGGKCCLVTQKTETNPVSSDFLTFTRMEAENEPPPFHVVVKKKEFSVKEFWTSFLPEIPANDKARVCQWIAKNMAATGHIPPKLSSIIRYYNALDFERIQPFVYDYEWRRNEVFLIEGNEHGVVTATVLTNKNDNVEATQWLGDLWAFGPRFFSSPLALRQDLRLKLLTFLAPNSDVKIEEAFPLIDYAKIPNLTFTSGNVSEEETITLLRGEIVNYYFIEHNQRGSTTYSLETLFFNPAFDPKSIPPIAQNYAEIVEAIGKGM